MKVNINSALLLRRVKVMKLYRAGDRSAGICEQCHSKVFTRMEYRDYTPPGWSVVVPEVLVALCERCDHVVSIPHQSTPRINAHRKTKSEKDLVSSIEARVPREIDEALDLLAVVLGGEAKSIRPAVIRYYLAQVASKIAVAEAVKNRSARTMTGAADRRIAIKLQVGLRSRVMKASRAVGIRSTSELLRGVAVLAAEDCKIALCDPNYAVVDDKESRHRRSFLKQMAGAL
jgi:hypothetical protein